MKKIFFGLLLAILATTAKAQLVSYEKSDSALVLSLLKEARQQPSGTNMVIWFGRQLQGVPYVAHTLEPFDKERLIVNLRELDCTTFVENVVALTMCHKDSLCSFEAFCHILQKLRYEQGDVPAYIKRNHYFTSWIEDNSSMGFCYELQSPNPPFTALQTIHVDYMTKNVDKYRMLTVNPQDVPEIRKMEESIEGKKYRYIPISEINNTKLLRETVHDGDILAIITNVKGLDTQHIALALWHDDGLHILHASSVRKKVVDEPVPLKQYLINRKTTPGIRVVRIRNEELGMRN
ncbi:MAG: DUF1460 domain-containing protein [Prevotella sp.]|nr:DUF1460 domain-containing protein [Prevotella sp.]